MHTLDAGLAHVCQHPEDITSRLLLADVYEEQGDAARAEFVRVQCELETLRCTQLSWVPREKGLCTQLAGECRHCDLRRRELELLRTDDAGAANVLREELPPVVPPWVIRLSADDIRREGETNIVVVRRGFVEEVCLTAAALCGGPCGRCASAGVAGITTGAVGGNCPACRGSGTVPGVAAELFRAAPVTRVVVSDKRPVITIRGGQWGWHDATRVSGDPASALPRGLFQLLGGGHRDDASVYYSDRQAALDALGRAVLLFGRRAGFPCPGCKGKGVWERARYQIGLNCPCPNCGGKGHTVSVAP